MDNAEFNIRLMNHDSRLLRALSDALALDLAVAPVVIASEAGIGTVSAVKGVAAALGSEFVDVRTAHVDENTFKPMPVLRGGTVMELQPRVEWLKGPMTRNSFCIVLLDEAHICSPTAMCEMLRWIADVATAPVVLVFHCDLDPASEELILGWIQQELSIHRAHVPTARLAIRDHGSHALRTVLNLVGDISTPITRPGSIDLVVHAPYSHSVTIDLLHDGSNAEAPFSNRDLPANGVAVRAELVNGRLTARISNFEVM